MTNFRHIHKENPAGCVRKWQVPLALALVAGLTIAVYWPVLSNGFISYDDTDYVTLNMVVRQGLTLKGFIWAFTSFHAANWHPLTWLSHMLDIELFDLNPMGHHATSLLLHTLNSLLLCGLLYRLTGFIGRSMFVAMLFAVHPLHVESVAWVAERKDVLSTLFWFLTMAAYAEYARKPCLKRYLPVIVLFALGLMAKQMLVTLPLVLLLMDYWPLNRTSPREEGGAARVSLKFILAEKIPLLMMSAAASLIIFRAQDSSRGITHGDGQSTLLNAGNALLSYVKYIRNMFWPADLALFYPFDPSAITFPRVAGAAALLVATTCVIVVLGRRHRYLGFGWCWYLITLLPVIGLVRIGGHALADRYTYIPLTGLFVVVVWGGAEIAGRWRKGSMAAGVGAAVAIAVLSVLTVNQVRYWRNSYDLFNHALAVTERNWMAHNNIGILLSQHQRHEEAILHFRESVRFNPGDVQGYRNLANAYQAAGRMTESIEALGEAVRIKPDDIEGHFRLGYAYLLSGSTDLAYREYLQLTRLDEPRALQLLDSIRLRAKK